jgi:hypothetical protein
VRDLLATSWVGGGVWGLAGCVAAGAWLLTRLLHTYAGDVSIALAAWASAESYETRLSPEGIDAKVLAVLRQAAG